MLSLLFFVKRNCESQTQLTHPDELEVSLSVVLPFFKIQHNLQVHLLIIHVQFVFNQVDSFWEKALYLFLHASIIKIMIGAKQIHINVVENHPRIIQLSFLIINDLVVCDFDFTHHLINRWSAIWFLQIFPFLCKQHTCTISYMYTIP